MGDGSILARVPPPRPPHSLDGNGSAGEVGGGKGEAGGGFKASSTAGGGGGGGGPVKASLDGVNGVTSTTQQHPTRPSIAMVDPLHVTTTRPPPRYPLTSTHLFSPPPTLFTPSHLLSPPTSPPPSPPPSPLQYPSPQ